MTTTTSPKTFTSSRAELDSDNAGEPATRVAHAVVATSTARMFCIAAAPGLLKRYDLWFAPGGVVAHARSADPDDPSPGLIAPRSAAYDVVAALIARTIGGLPAEARPGRTSLPSIDDLLPAIARSDDGADRAVVIGREAHDGSFRYVVCAELHGGGMIATEVDPEQRLRLEPGTAVTMWAAIVGLVPAGPEG